MNILDRKEKELKRLWQLANLANGPLKEDLLHKFWREYRILRKNKKFQREIIKNDVNNVGLGAS